MSLYLPQIQALQPALNEPTKRYVLNWEQGTGKTPAAITLMQAFGVQSVLVVCPSMVKRSWQDQLDTWWPGHPGVDAISTHDEALLAKAPIQIVSYGLVQDVWATDWYLIIIDEIHFVKAPGSVRSLAVRELVKANPKAYILALTGTLMPNDIGDVWNPLDMLWPDRFGSHWKFRHRYQNSYEKVINAQTGESRTQFEGLNPLHADELKMRLSAISTRVTREDVAEYLPPFDIKLLRMSTDPVASGAQDVGEIERGLELAAHAKLGQVVDWVVDTQETTSHVCALAYHQAVAREMFERLTARLPLKKIIYVDGTVPIPQRINALEAAKSAPDAIVVAALKSVGIGIDLTWLTQAIFAELYWSPGVMEQVLLRFSRLSGKLPSAVYFSLVPGSIDEVIAVRLADKFRAINPTTAKPGEVGGRFENLLDISDAEWLAGLTKAAAQLQEEDYLE